MEFAENAFPEDMDLFDWLALPTLSNDENGLDLALLLARNSRCKNGSMGCVVVDQKGQVIAGHVNGPMWEPNARRPASDLHAEVNAIGRCAMLGRSTAGCTVYVTMPPCKRCFMLLVASGVKRIVTRKQMLQQEAKEIEPAARRHEISLEVVLDSEERRRRLDELGAARTAKRRKTDPESTADVAEGATVPSAEEEVKSGGARKIELKFRMVCARQAHAWQPKAAPPKAAPPKVAVKARLPEELGFNVSKDRDFLASTTSHQQKQCPLAMHHYFNFPKRHLNAMKWSDKRRHRGHRQKLRNRREQKDWNRNYGQRAKERERNYHSYGKDWHQDVSKCR
ncbi:unnamed protein product [Cladocopium goreaui]|uniref:dCMP deaminase n=1 Tax=Cladocopium goreaui TaxID=2562237 RepID=A0A9P1BNG8_9DINO|nr:unnamed protein product [Cladocopium goreaui]